MSIRLQNKDWAKEKKVFYPFNIVMQMQLKSVQ